MAKMTLTEYLNSNPEAMAEQKEAIKNAVGEGVKAAVAEERARGEEILNLASGNVSENVLNAYKDGLTAGEYAVNEIKVNNQARETVTQNLGTIEPTNQVPTSPNSEEAKNKATEDAVDKFLEGDK